MATKNPKGPQGPDDDKDKKNADLPDWLRTDDWLQITPPPPSKIIPGQPTGKPPSGNPSLPGEDQPTDMIELDDDESVYNVDVPPSTMLFSDPDDSVSLADDLPIIGPLSGKLRSGNSSIRLRSSKAPGSKPDLPPSAENSDDDDEIDLGSLPMPENPLTAGPATSSIRRPSNPPTDITPITPISAEDVLGQPLTPTGPASGWLGTSAKKSDPTPASPSIPNVQGTWAELDIPTAKAAPPASSPVQTGDSWHPSSGDVGLPSMASIDLPPGAEGPGSDVFSKATRPGAAPGAMKYEPPKIAIPKAPAAKQPEEKPAAMPAMPSLQLPSLPNVPATIQPGSWHPSSGDVNMGSGEIDLPPVEGSVADVFSAATRPGRPISESPPPPKPASPIPSGLEATMITAEPPTKPVPSKPSTPMLSGLEATMITASPTTDSPSKPVLPSLGNVLGTWADLDAPAAKLAPTPPSTPSTPVVAPKVPSKPSTPMLSGLEATMITASPTADSPSKPVLPSLGNVLGTWADLGAPAAKLAPTPPSTPVVAPKAPSDPSPDSWHPSSGNVGLPSLANIDLPPIEATSMDIFSKATRPGAAPGAMKYEPPKIALPKAPAAEKPAAKPPEEKLATPATPSLQLPSMPNLPAEMQPGSWHPSSGDIGIPSMANIDLPPMEATSADIFSKATRPGQPKGASTPPKPAAPKPPAKPAAPQPSGLEATMISMPDGPKIPTPREKTPVAKGPKAPEPKWLDATNFAAIPTLDQPTDPASGWLAGASKVAKTTPTPPAKPPVPPAPAVTADEAEWATGSSSDIELPASTDPASGWLGGASKVAKATPATPTPSAALAAPTPPVKPPVPAVKGDEADWATGSSADIELPASTDPASGWLGGASKVGKATPATPTPPIALAAPTPPVAPPVPVVKADEAEWATGSSADIELPASTDPASGWLGGASKAAKATPATPATPKPPAKSAVPAETIGLDPTSDFATSSSADIDLPPPKNDEASDIFSTARPPKDATGARPPTDSQLYSGAMSFDSKLFQNTTGEPTESNLFAEPPGRKDSPKAEDTGRVNLAPPGLEATGELYTSQLLPGSKTDAVNFALPKPTGDDSNASSIEVLDTSGTYDDAPKSDRTQPYQNPLSGEVLPEPKFGSLADEIEAELLSDLNDEEGKHDFNLFPGVQPSDSNLLGDRTFVENALHGPHSSSVNLADPNALSTDAGADSGQPSSIFNKGEQLTQSSGGHVDLDSIPLMGSSDDATHRLETSNSAVLGGRLDDPGELEESVFDVKLPKDENADSGLIDWSADAARMTDRLNQATLDQTQRSDLADEGPMAAIPVVPRPKVTDRPRSRPELSLDELEDRAPSKSRTPWLLTALSLLAGAGIGAGAMFFASGSGDVKPPPGADAAQQRAAELAKKADDLDATNKKLDADIKTLQNKVGESATAVAAAKKAEDDKQRLAIELAAAKEKAVEDLATAKKKADEEIALAKKKADEDAAKKFAVEKMTLLADAKKATDEAAKLALMVEAATKDVTAKAKELDAAKTASDAIAAKLKATDATLDPIIEKLKAAKLIDDKADREKAIAALPEAMKKANLITGEGDAAKLAKELTDARDLLKKQKDDADKTIKTATDNLTAAKTAADKQLADAKATADKAMTELQAKVDAADKKIADEVKKAVATATKEADDKLAKTQDMIAAQKQAADLEIQKEKTARAAEMKQLDAKLAAQAEQFAKDLAAARSGANVPNNDLLAAKAEQASTAYDTGATAYFAGRYDDAEQAFAKATKAEAADARFWYFLGLSKYAQGRTAEAAADFKTGAEWESRAKPGRRAVASSLERVQGAARLALEAARP